MYTVYNNAYIHFDEHSIHADVEEESVQAFIIKNLFSVRQPSQIV